MHTSNHSPESRVAIAEDRGEWTVTVFERGDSHASSFELESFARAYAEGQKIRLGLNQVAETGL